MTEVMPSRKGGLGQALRVIGQLALTALVTLAILRAFGFRRINEIPLTLDWAQISLLRLGVATLVLFASFALAARFWGWMTQEFGAADPGVRGSFRIVLAANLGRYLPGKVWQLAGLALLARRRGIPAATGTAASLVVQGFTLGATLLWSLPLLFPHPMASAGSSGGATVLEGNGGWFALGLLVFLLGLASIPGVTRWGVRVLFRLSQKDPAEAPIPSSGFGPRWIAWNVLLWGGYGFAFVLFIQGLGFHVPLLFIISAFSGAYLLGYLAFFAPAGIGVREGVLAGLLVPWVGEGALAVALLARLWMTAVEVIPAAYFLWAELRFTPVSSSES